MDVRGGEEEAREGPLALLNEDCLLQVLGYFSVTKRIQLEAVCRRWRRLVRKSFRGARSVNVAAFVIETAPTYQTHYQQDHIAFTPTTQGLISHCAPFVEELSFGHQWLKLSQPIVDDVAASCSRLSALDLSGSIVDADVLPALSVLAPKLRRLNLDDTTFVRPSAQGLHLLFYRFIHLKELGLAHASFPLRRLVDLPTDLLAVNLAQVRQLHPATLLEFLQEHPDLQMLNLADYQDCQPEMLKTLAALPDLQYLDLSGASGEAGEELDFSPLARLGSLRTLLLSRCRSLNTPTFRIVAAGLYPTLERLEMVSCSGLLDFSPLGLLVNLRELTVAGTYQLCDEDLELVAEGGALEVLALSACPNVTDAALRQLAKACPLRQASLGKCQELTDEALLALASVPLLSLQSCQISGRGLVRLARELPERLAALRELDLSYNRGVTDEGVEALVYALSNPSRGPPPGKRQRKESPAPPDPLTLYLHQTSVTQQLIDRLPDWLTVIA